MGKSLTVDLDDDAGEPVDEDQLVTAAVVGPDVVDEDANTLDKLPDHAIKNTDGSVTLPLLYPQELQVRKAGNVRTDKYERLIFHRLNGADQRAIAAASDNMTAVVAFSRSTRINQAVMNALFDKLDGADINAGGQVLNSFFATGRTTGK